jgi:hypothetical protein
VIALTASEVHQDPLPDTSEDFLVRPIRRGDLLLAKLLFIAVIVLGPVFAADVLESVLSGFDLWISFSAGFADALSKFLLLALPAMALASVSRNLTELLAGTLLLVVPCAVLLIVISGTRGTIPDLSASGLEWIRPVSIALLFLIVGTFVLPTQYARRTTFAARGMIAVGGLLAAMLWTFIPWSPSFAAQQMVGGHGGDDSSFHIAYAPEIGRVHQTEGLLPVAGLPGQPANLVPLFLPLRIEGVSPDAMLLMDRAVFRIKNTDGRILYEGTMRTFLRSTPRVRGSSPVDKADKAPSFSTHEQLLIPASLLPRLQSLDAAVEIDYSFTFMGPQAAQKLPALGGDVAAGGRRCLTRADDEGDDLNVACLSPVKAPPCATVYLEHDATGTRNPSLTECLIDYSPYPLTIAPRVMKRLSISIPFYDPARSISYPVNASMLKDSHVVIVPYEAVGHSSRHLVIPSVRIGDWEAQT